MKKLKNKLFYIYAFLLYLVIICVFILLANKFIKPYADSLLLSKVSSMIQPDYDVVEIVFDDSTNQKYSWLNDSNNEITANILDYFHTYAKPKVVGLDIGFVSFRDEMAPKAQKFLTQIGRMNNLVSGFFPEQDLRRDDKYFIDNFKQNHSMDVKIQTKKKFKTNYHGIISYSDILRKTTKHYGSVVIQKDAAASYTFDCINIVKIGDAYYPSLSLKMYLLANNTNQIVITDKDIVVPKTGLKFPYRYKGGNFYSPIRYYRLYPFGGGEPTYSHFVIPAYKILDTYEALQKGITPKTNPRMYDVSKNAHALLNPDLFKNKIIFIGENISGANQDVLRTPMEERHPGVDVQASTYNNLSGTESIHNAGFPVNVFLFLLLCISAFVVIMRSKFIKGIISLCALDVVYLIFVIIFALFGYITSYAVPLVCQFVTAAFAYTFKFINENRNKEQIKNAMGKYLSQDVMKNVVKNIDNLGLGGKRTVVTVLFSDIRGFTSMSEKMQAVDVSKILNEYFAEMEPIITKYNGIINKFIGDAIMVIFGEPIQDINHPQNAVKCAYEMLKKVEYLREKWLFEGRPKFEIGIGINTGEVFIGNIGTENRMEYTVIGDTVNLASRIESYNKVYKTNLLVSASTYNYISDIADVIKIKEVQIRGKSKKMDIYEVLRIDLDK